jgi:uncharacterized ubiquitin-like protein YukD
MQSINKHIEQVIEKSKINETDNNEMVKITSEILKFISNHSKSNEIFVTNKYFFDNEQSKWLSNPIDVYCKFAEDLTKELCDNLYHQKFKYVRSRSDIVPNIILVESNFNNICRVIRLPESYDIKNLIEMSNNVRNVNIITKPYLSLSEIYLDFINPDLYRERWLTNLNIEKNIWSNFKIPEIKQIKTNSTQIKPNNYHAQLIGKLEECQEPYAITGEYTINNLLNKQVVMDSDSITLFVKNIDYFVEMCTQLFPLSEIEKVELDGFLHFWKRGIKISVDKTDIVTLYETDFSINITKMNLLNHTNFHGTLMYIFVKILENNDKERYYLELLNFLLRSKEEFLNKNKVNELDNHKYTIFNKEIMGKSNDFFLKCKIKEWNRENRFQYRPDKEEKEVEEETL